jgi:ABC-type antimicrobial peptide transport system permease subunit
MATATYGRHALANLPMGQLFTAVALSTLVGVGLTVAGAVYPAWQAARMQPIEAMRAET